MIEARIEQTIEPIDGTYAKKLYKVEYRHINRNWKTFGVYESLEVASIVEEYIRTGYINV